MRTASKSIQQNSIRSKVLDVPYLPGTVKIGPFDFIVHEWSPREASLRGCMGETDLSSLIIRIRSDLPAQRMKETPCMRFSTASGTWPR
jgi:hypothetical protein